MAASKYIDWLTCAEDDCIGVRLPTGGKCWAHADDEDVETALKRLGEDGTLDARGVPVTPELTERLLETRRGSEGHIRLTSLRFEEAIFDGVVGFAGVIVEGDSLFFRATFNGQPNFSGAIFKGRTSFDEATFKQGAWFMDTRFEGRVTFGSTTFGGPAWFLMARFESNASFSHTTFRQEAAFVRAISEDVLSFEAATFETARELGPLLVRRQLELDRATFYQQVQIETAAATLCARRARFLGGVQLLLRWAQVVLDDAYLAGPSLLTTAPPFVGFGPRRLPEELYAPAWERLPPARRGDSRVRVLSLRRADVAGLTIANADLRACRFVGAHHLDQLRVEEAEFPSTPPGWQWTSRRTIAEEHYWRAAHPHPSGTSTATAHATHAPHVLSGGVGRSGWYRRVHRLPAWLVSPLPNAVQIAAVYRALRKGREDNKDEAGAADFYYGEMEMRRRAAPQQRYWERRHRGTATAASIESAILWLYWLVSGYGLRAWRAMAAFLVVLVMAAGLFAFGGGFAPSTSATAVSPGVTTLPGSTNPPSTATTATADRSFGGALVYSARTVIGLTREPQPRLTRFGDVVQILLRILGPVLLGLGVLSVRGRVKR